jgi:uncharacterized protein GlcG (DUF336 family)
MTINTTSNTILSTDTALDIIGKAMAIGQTMGMRASVWIVGPALEKIAFASADGATPHSRNSSLKKAQTAASTRKATGWMSGNLAIELPMAADGLLTNVPGGLPILAEDGQVVGAIGVAGGTVEQDAELAGATLQACGIGV